MTNLTRGQATPGVHKMIGFHIDFNVHHFKRDYLERWLTDLAALGYDTILWELEDAVAWDTCPECAPPDAYTKDEFRELLALSRRLGLEPVPLLQTIGHCEYVLRHGAYSHLAETPDRVDQYCPRNRQLVPFLRDWIDEYLDLFGDVRYFHIGADEAWQLGSCPDCKAYAEQHSLSQLYIDHVNAVCARLIERGVRPCIWADMILTTTRRSIDFHARSSCSIGCTTSIAATARCASGARGCNARKISHPRRLRPSARASSPKATSPAASLKPSIRPTT